ncbi:MULTISPECIES: XdhC family protein [Haloplanus]|uniref:XdhC family protein n=1 Tax=Haloplanus TaxID=376170 RepID=UPI0018EE7C47|nr:MULTISPECIES: XdhC/CoxI family protein [Haloplanus]
MSADDLVPDDEWSAPEADVMASIRRGIDAEGTPILATIVGVEGSAYRGPGAKMLVAGDTGLGSITAGCLEDVMLDLAAEVRADGRPRVEQFDLTGDDDVWGLGVGCNGVIDVLLEPLDGSLRPALDAYDEGRESLVYTVVDADHSAAPVGARTVAVGDDPTPADPPEWFGDDLAAAARECRRAGDSKTVECPRPDGRIAVFVDHVTPPADLVVFGTGHDVRPVTELARRADFRVTVAGFRGADATDERFPAAHTVRSLSPAQIRSKLDLDSDTYAVVMTHNFVDDAIAVGELLESDVPYVGLMGPAERFEEIAAEWREEGREPSEAALQRLYTPVGLDLGGGTPYQIAHSIVAELLAVRYGRTPTHLRAGESLERRLRP